MKQLCVHAELTDLAFTVSIGRLKKIFRQILLACFLFVPRVSGKRGSMKLTANCYALLGLAGEPSLKGKGKGSPNNMGFC